METDKAIAVIIINYNSKGYLETCLSSLDSQKVKPKRTIVVDNASTDESIDMIPTRFPKIELIKLKSNIGFAAANNLAAKQASDCDWIVLLNPDVQVATDFLEKLRYGIQQHPEVGFFGCHMISLHHRNILDGTGDVYHMSGLVWREGHGKNIESSPRIQKEIFSPCAAAAMYRKDAFLQIGGFDEDYFCYIEDADLGFRLRLAGFTCIYIPDAVVYHAGSATSGGKHSDFSVYHAHRNLVWTFIKNMPGLLFWVLFPLHLILNIVTVTYFVIKGQGGVILKAKWDAFKCIPWIWRKRRETQLHRRASAMDLWRMLDKRLIPIRRWIPPKF
ncbi:glycosyltransferase family 2 protein [Candidatus Saccharibacteria bacterium]|nr:glycosyltransferase family 2 protein [Candidatus Saccharibacteria bacterium]NIW78143.1 glycosyltransferase [Calditrichia bacterium]